MGLGLFKLPWSLLNKRAACLWTPQISFPFKEVALPFSLLRFEAQLLLLMGFPGGSADREPACNVGDLGLIPGLGRSPGGGNGYPLQYSGLENFLECIVHGVAKSWMWLSDFHFTLLLNSSETSKLLLYNGGIIAVTSQGCCED